MKVFQSDIELVERLQKGDIDAFDVLYDKYSGKLYAFGLKYLKSTDEAEELIQSIFLKLWENYKNLNKELSFKSYLFTIAYNDICKLFRKRNFHQKFIEDTLYDCSQASSNMEDGIDYQSVLEQVQHIVDLLPEKQKTIFQRRKEGKSTKEIAGEVGLSPGTVDNNISATMKFIRSHLKDESLPVVLFFSLFFL